MGRQRILNEEQLEYFKAIQKGRFKQDVATMMNERFGLNLKAAQIANLRRGAGVVSGATLVGTKRNDLTRTNSRGERAGSWKPVGSIVKVNGYYQQKVSDFPPRWEFLHRIIWEQAYGPVPSGYRPMFLDGNPENVCLENLELVSVAELLAFNKMGRVSKDRELTKTQLNIARIRVALSSRRKEC